MKKVLVGLITGLLCIMPAAGVMAEEAAAETKEAAAETTNETQALSDDIYSFQAEIDGEIYQFPMSFEEFTAKGWTYDGDAAQTMEPEQYTTAETFKKDSPSHPSRTGSCSSVTYWLTSWVKPESIQVISTASPAGTSPRSSMAANSRL